MSVTTLDIADTWQGRVKTILAQRGAVGLAWLVLLAISTLVLPPLLMIIVDGMTDSQPGDPLHFTLDTINSTYGEPSLYRSLLNSIIYAASTSSISLLIGGTLAWLVERTDGAPRSLVRLFSIVPILLPAVVFTSAWIMLLNPTSGPVARLLALFLPRSASVSAYSFGGMIFIGALQDLPLAFLWLWPAFKAINTQLEEAAYMSGASAFRVTTRITLPLLAPALLASALISFITGLSALSVPLMVGLPEKSFCTPPRFTLRSTGYHPTSTAPEHCASCSWF